MMAFKKAAGMLAQKGKIVISFEYSGSKAPRDQITTVGTEVEGMKSSTQLYNRLPAPIHAEGKDILRKLYAIEETFFDAEVVMVMQGEKVAIYDGEGTSLKVDGEMMSRIRHLMQAILKFHGTYESYMLNNAFIIGDFVGGLMSASDVSTTERYGG
jgi:hypothetical protein